MAPTVAASVYSSTISVLFETATFTLVVSPADAISFVFLDVLMPLLIIGVEYLSLFMWSFVTTNRFPESGPSVFLPPHSPTAVPPDFSFDSGTSSNMGRKVAFSGLSGTDIVIRLTLDTSAVVRASGLSLSSGLGMVFVGWFVSGIGVWCCCRGCRGPSI